MKYLPIVEVLWRDAECDEPSWEEDEKSIGWNCPLVRSVGQLMEQTDKVITLVTTISEGHNVGRFRIPASMVESIFVLKPAGETEVDVYA